MRTINYLCLMLVLTLPLVGCGVKVQEKDAKAVMDAIYKARKKGSIASELKHYAKKDFKIVPFVEVESSLYSIIGSAGRLKSVKPLKVRTQRRNQLGEGLITYMILSYEATYSNMTLLESYYFLGSSEKPKLVYMTLQL
ncbi:MAG: hypothetical protein ACRBCI_14240 [Cellvibrionaceae bacterium]